MTDPTLDELKGAWKRTEIDPTRIARGLEQRKRRLRWLLVLETTGAALALVFCCWFAWIAISRSNALFGLGAAALLAGLTVTMITGRRRKELEIESGPSGVLQQTLRNMDDLEKALKRWRWSGVILLTTSLAVWCLYLIGATGLRDAAVFSTIWTGAALAVTFWSTLRIRQLRLERMTAERLLAEFAAADA